MNDLQAELVLASASGAEPLSLADAKLYLKVDSSITADDSLISAQITDARIYLETFCRRSFRVGDIYNLTLNRFPYPYLEVNAAAGYVEGAWPWEIYGTAAAYLGGLPTSWAIEIPKGPITAVNSVTYVDTTGTVQTLPASSYLLVQEDEASPRLWPTFGNYWPVTQMQPNAVVINFTAGSSVVSTPIGTALRMLVADFYDNRTNVPSPNVQTAAERLMRPFRLIEF